MIGAALVYREFEGTSVESLLIFGFGTVQSNPNPSLDFRLNHN